MTDPTAEAGSNAEEPQAEETEAVEVFENRAARRAKGKKAAQHTHSSAGHVHGRSGTVTGPRQYGNRRSG
ncbi:hypothetical protein [Actinoplanes solisilvae]|uniref:hypothetical protein n=1 Tax=Actinoplanes solisilvae TaxID=2486853 RepID=UPI000FD74B64|nr:hypothetical protein [Actinoplanes solisilvae]